MLPKISLLDELRKGGYESSLITTFNAYLPFYEEVVLRRLVNAGIRHNVLMMDSRQYASSIASHRPQLAGRNYSLVPIGVLGAFHPKLIMLFGKNKGLVAVGSHNMTLAGFGFNRELTNILKIEGKNDAEGVSIASTAWAEVEAWVDNFAADLPKKVIDMVRRCQDFAPWLTDSPLPQEKTRLIATRPGGAKLWDQFKELVSGRVEEVSVIGAFFDRKLEFIQRIQKDLNPNKLVVGVDPDSVQISNLARDLTGIEFRKADRLGTETQKDEESASAYLHAKGMLVRQTDGKSIFVSGSANPSRPAWLAERGNGNVEMMLIRQGRSAVDSAAEIGFSELASSPLLTDIDWNDIAKNKTPESDPVSEGVKAGIAVVEDGIVQIGRFCFSTLESIAFALIGRDGQEITRSTQFSYARSIVRVEFTSKEIAFGSWIYCYQDERLVAKLLLHHAREVEEQSRTGVQRQFKDALLSLNTDSPDISLLIRCIDKIVFSENQNLSTQTPKVSLQDKEEKKDDSEDLGSFAIDVDEVKKRVSKKRVNHNSDFAYILNTLIYHLRPSEFEPNEELDRLGRSEEEQVDADDDDATDSPISGPDIESLLKLCHKKVRTIVNRMIAQTQAYLSKEQDFGGVLMRLLAVLATLRELRNCDGRTAWVPKGKATVPTKERLRLLEAIMFSLFEGESSLLGMRSIDSQLEMSDDVARAKGLIVWLAWDCGLTLDFKKPFMESSKQLEERLRRNAIVLALAQMISRDEVVIDEAKRSIGGLTYSEFDWLNGMLRIVSRTEDLKSDRQHQEVSLENEPGNIAVHKTRTDWKLRIVESRGGKNVSLIQLDRRKPSVSYGRDHLIISSL